jgi:hypothetical protein
MQRLTRKRALSSFLRGISFFPTLPIVSPLTLRHPPPRKMQPYILQYEYMMVTL